MRDRGSVSFVVEVKKRRWASPQGLMRPTDGDGKRETSTTAVAPRSFFVLPSEPRPISDPTADAARAAAERLFGGSPRQTPATDEASTAAAPAPAPPADAPTPSSEPPAADVAAAATVSVTPPAAEQPRTGRILASLIGEDPIAALMRQKTEEEARQRRAQRALRASMAPASDTPASAADESKPATRVRGKAKVKRDALASSGAIATPSGEAEAGTTITTDPRATRRKARTAKTKGRQHAAAGRTARARTGAKRNARKLTAKASTATKAAAKKAVAKRAKAKATTAQARAGRKASARTRAQTKALSSRKTAGRTGAAAKRSAKAAASRKNAKGGGVRKGAATARKGAAARKRRTR